MVDTKTLSPAVKEEVSMLSTMPLSIISPKLLLVIEATTTPTVGLAVPKASALAKAIFGTTPVEPVT